VDVGTSGRSGRYAAFLSYSHRDAAAARALHRRLESYRLPRRLVGSAGERGPVPARLVPIFRDREELAAAGDLSEKVRAALAESNALVILCSPAAAASPWVGKEIDTFRALHPHWPIIAAILDGEPCESFPPALTAAGAEPLAADLRPGRDGRRLGFLKLVAGLSGVGLDQLVQRDAQRRLRRVTAVTGVALAAVVVMAVMTTIALQARREAQRQRAEAEGLVEFMLTDLRDKLRGVGRLDAMQAVNERALRYYGASGDVSQLDDASVARRARVLHAVGEDELESESLERAIAAFRAASATMRVQALRHPEDKRLALEEGRNQYGIGRVHELRKEWRPAAAHYRAFAVAADRAALVAPGPQTLAEAGAAAIDEGNVAFGRDEVAQAQRYYEKAVRLLGQASTAAPGNLHILLARANALGWLASAHYAQQRWPEALRTREAQRTIVGAARVSDPGNADVKFRLASADRGLGCASLRNGRASRALAAFREAAALTAELRRIDNGNPQWRSLQAALRDDVAFTRPAAALRLTPRPPNRPDALSHGVAVDQKQVNGACRPLH
jgi:tetratricopeptide (TPR) repeat protein